MTTQKPDNELDALLPDSDIEIRGEAITVTEITFIQSLPLEPVIQPMIDDLAELFIGDDSRDDGAAVSYQAMASVFGSHAELLLRMLSLATGKPRDWIESLSDADGQLLTMTFWQVNKDFFTRRLVIETMAGKLKHKDAVPDGAASLPH